MAKIAGGCTCGDVRYELARAPYAVHCCHCTACQRESGSAFAVNALVEVGCLRVTGAPEAVMVPSGSGKGQRIMRCPTCRVALWSHYAGMGDGVAFMRAGTFDEPEAFPPQVHIYRANGQNWFALPPDAPQFDAFYRFADVDRLFGAEGGARWKAGLPLRE